MPEYNEMEEGEVFSQCQECGSDIDIEQYNRTGTDSFCDDCELDCSDPRGHTFENCGCFDEED